MSSEYTEHQHIEYDKPNDYHGALSFVSGVSESNSADDESQANAATPKVITTNEVVELREELMILIGELEELVN